MESVYIFSTISMASSGNLRFSMMASSLAWSIEPNAFLKSM